MRCMRGAATKHGMGHGWVRGDWDSPLTRSPPQHLQFDIWESALCSHLSEPHDDVPGVRGRLPPVALPLGARLAPGQPPCRLGGHAVVVHHRGVCRQQLQTLPAAASCLRYAGEVQFGKMPDKLAVAYSKGGRRIIHTTSSTRKALTAPDAEPPASLEEGEAEGPRRAGLGPDVGGVRAACEPGPGSEVPKSGRSSRIFCAIAWMLVLWHSRPGRGQACKSREWASGARVWRITRAATARGANQESAPN